MKTRKMILTALFVALGIVLPQTFHIIGGTSAGSIFLPMHLPVLIGGLLLGPLSGVIIGASSVIVGMMLGMPPILIGVYMLAELSVYGLVGGYTSVIKKQPIWLSFLITKISGMMVAFATIHIMISFFNVSFPPIIGSTGMFVMMIPGLAIQILIVPYMVHILKKEVVKYDIL
jgi:niacin transporter